MSNLWQILAVRELIYPNYDLVGIQRIRKLPVQKSFVIKPAHTLKFPHRSILVYFFLG